MEMVNILKTSQSISRAEFNGPFSWSDSRSQGKMAAHALFGFKTLLSCLDIDFLTLQVQKARIGKSPLGYLEGTPHLTRVFDRYVRRMEEWAILADGHAQVLLYLSVRKSKRN